MSYKECNLTKNEIIEYLIKNDNMDRIDLFDLDYDVLVLMYNDRKL